MSAVLKAPPVAAVATDPVLAVAELRIAFPGRDGGEVPVVDGVGFTIGAGELVGIVGESGSGKSLTARAVLGLVPPAARVTGSIRFRGEEVLAMSPARLRGMRGAEAAMVFQDPMTSFNPVLRIGEQIGEAITLHRSPPRGSLMGLVRGLLARVAIPQPEERARAYPHEFSGGMRQRAITAMALANEPALLIADEPTTALDVTVQDQILRLLREMNAQGGSAVLLITHNIAVVASLCRRVIVMYAGRVVEDGPVERILGDPQHPYTWSLLRSVPRLDRQADRLVAIQGQPPNPAEMPRGCKFHPRCPWAEPRCAVEEPPLGEVADGHRARCWVLMRHAEGVPA
jgi:peptide/nickel transport system ATP-binding protein